MADRILIIDDNRSDLENMSSILEKEGYEVVTSSSGEQALLHLSSDGFKLALIDINMPTLSGKDVMKLIRDRVGHKIKIAYVSIVPKKDVDMEGVDGFIQKPFSPESLVKKVKKIL